MEQPERSGPKSHHGKYAVAPAPDHGARQSDHHSGPHGGDQAGKRQAHFGCELERGAVGAIPYPSDRNLAAAIFRENPPECAEAGPEEWILPDDLERRSVGLRPSAAGKPSRIEPSVDGPAQDRT